MHNLIRNCQTTFQSGCTISQAPALYDIWSFSTPLTALCIVSLHFIHSSGCVVATCMVLICISLMNNDIEPHFLCLLATHISSLETFLFKIVSSFKKKKNELFIFILFSCRSYLYGLDTGPLSDLCSESIFSQSMAYLFCFLTVAFTNQRF